VLAAADVDDLDADVVLDAVEADGAFGVGRIRGIGM
jgi:hypothetical protein